VWRQVIAREEKGVLGVDYNRSPKAQFTTQKKNVVVEQFDPLPGGGEAGPVEEIAPVFEPITERNPREGLLQPSSKDNQVTTL